MQFKSKKSRLWYFCVVYVLKLSENQNVASNNKITEEKWIVKDLEASGIGLAEVLRHRFPGGSAGKPRKTSGYSVPQIEYLLDRHRCVNLLGRR
jgi:hypothetical protein